MWVFAVNERESGLYRMAVVRYRTAATLDPAVVHSWHPHNFGWLEGLQQHRVFTVQQHKHTDNQYIGHNCTSKMANVRGLLVLGLVSLLLCQMMSLGEACEKIAVCISRTCGKYCCGPHYKCGYCSCLDSNGSPHRITKCK
ncbi:hypothetical protein LSAT2_027001 [Lamellibrachia satsuma]|nr:hypothetical protein LSAT2_027001 [Lamellibrachia satsuma]